MRLFKKSEMIRLFKTAGAISEKKQTATPKKQAPSVNRKTASVDTKRTGDNKKKRQFNRRVAAKAMTLMEEGKPRKQAFAMAYNFAGANGKDRLGNAKG